MFNRAAGSIKITDAACAFAGRSMVGVADSTVGGVLGLILTIVTIAMMATGSKDACFSYLMAFAYWAGISYASVILLMIFLALIIAGTAAALLVFSASNCV